MVFAIAALLLNLTSATQAPPDVTAQAAVNSTTPTDPAPVRTDSQPAAPADGASKETSSGTLTVTSLTTTDQNFQSLSNVRVPDVQPAKPVEVIGVESLPSRRNWLILSLAQHSAAAFDAYSTRVAVSSGAHENDPLMRPFANSPGIYAAIQAGPLVLDFAARKMQRSENGFLRHSWWLPQSVSTGIYLFSGVHNLHVADRPK